MAPAYSCTVFRQGSTLQERLPKTGVSPGGSSPETENTSESHAQGDGSVVLPPKPPGAGLKVPPPRIAIPDSPSGDESSEADTAPHSSSTQQRKNIHMPSKATPHPVGRWGSHRPWALAAARETSQTAESTPSQLHAQTDGRGLTGAVRFWTSNCMPFVAAR